MPNELNGQDNIYSTSPREDESKKFVADRRENIKSDLIIITHDKLENILLKHLERLLLKNKWLTPLSLFISIFVTLLTASFKDAFGLTKEIWTSIFIVCCIISLFWLIVSVISLIKHRKETTIESLINKIKAIV
jgi:hypothetical protein